MEDKQYTCEDMICKFYGKNAKPKGKQKTIFNKLVAGKDKIAVLPTGSGKSFCFQAPACLLDGITLVISPLSVLIKDQVCHFNDKKIIINGKTIRAVDIKEYCLSTVSTLKEIASDKQIKLVYITPERLAREKFRRAFKEAGWLKPGVVSMIAIDEVHCMSQWGFDFRPSYLKIGEFIDLFDQRPIISGFTATATMFDVNTIKKVLHIKTKTLFDLPVRTNLQIKIEKKDTVYIKPKTKRIQKSILETIYRILNDEKINGDTIVYCQTRNIVNLLANTLDIKDDDIIPFHAGKTKAEKEEAYRKVMSDNSGRRLIIVTTNAFGMGVDKPDFRCVIHLGMPNSIEEYYQEIGRAGRDGKNAYCFLIYTSSGNSMPYEKSSGTIMPQMSKKTKTILAGIRASRYVLLKELISRKLNGPDKDFDIQAEMIEYFKKESIDEVLRNALDCFKDDKNKTDQNTINSALNVTNESKNKSKQVTILTHFPYEFHINNTKLANVIRSGEYEINKEYKEKVREWRSKRIPQLKFGEKYPNKYHVSGKSIFWNDMVLIKRPEARITTVFLNGYFMEHVYPEISIKNDNRFFAAVENDKIVRIYKLQDGFFKNVTLTGTFNIDGITLPISNYLGTYDKQIIFDNPNIFRTVNGIEISEFKEPRSYNYSFKLSDELTYWDMMIADAVYSVMKKDNGYVHVRDIIRLVLGKNMVSMQYDKRDVMAESVITSINKMINTEFTLNRYKSEPFLPLTKVSKYTYSYKQKPLLYRYAEKQNGQLLKFPSELMNCGSRNLESCIVNHYLIHRAYIFRKSSRGRIIEISKILKLLPADIDAISDKNMSRVRTNRYGYIDAALDKLNESGIIKYTLYNKFEKPIQDKDAKSKNAYSIKMRK